MLIYSTTTGQSSFDPAGYTAPFQDVDAFNPYYEEDWD